MSENEDKIIEQLRAIEQENQEIPAEILELIDVRNKQAIERETLLDGTIIAKLSQNSKLTSYVSFKKVGENFEFVEVGIITYNNRGSKPSKVLCGVFDLSQEEPRPCVWRDDAYHIQEDAILDAQEEYGKIQATRLMRNLSVEVWNWGNRPEGKLSTNHIIIQRGLWRRHLNGKLEPGLVGLLDRNLGQFLIVKKKLAEDKARQERYFIAVNKK